MAKCYCGKCGKTLGVGDKFCRYCGSGDVKVEEIKPKVPDFIIKNGVLEKCNIFGVKNVDWRIDESLKGTYPSIFSNRYGLNSLTCFERLYYSITGAEKGQRFDRYPKEVNDFVTSFKKNHTYAIPSKIKRVSGSYKGVCAFEYCSFYKLTYSPNTEFDEYALNNCYVHYFVFPNKCEQLSKASFGELSFDSSVKSRKSMALSSCTIGKLIVPSYITTIHDCFTKKDHQTSYYDELWLLSCTIKELVVGKYVELIDHKNDSVFPRTKIETIRYGGKKEDVYDKKLYNFGGARRFICTDGSISIKHLNSDTIHFTDDIPSNVKYIKLILKNDGVNGLGLNYFKIKYKGLYSGIIYKSNGCFNKTFAIDIPETVKSVEIIKNDDRSKTFYRPSYGDWIADVRNM